ncbi:hypothetical protein LEP48_09735 [Isoptericola sp. NEAU-Y5]|uniref:Uncharacterized protein n=1 Tax=Isoptericola luteus TaxID=2879484 RepID=A0ABS7ZIJ0_9MICO|nr:hypothetical protein [Isoptericola sp. NEAU-Y5]MCA5893629.1 hypothetical protein [Isoptericola sp. NEAU-Y5]
MRRTLFWALRDLLVPGTLLGVLTGLALGVIDGGAFTTWAMFLGALAGAVLSAGGIVAGSLVATFLRNSGDRARRLGAAAGVGTGVAGTSLVLATQVPLVSPWPTVGPLVLLAVAGTWACARFPQAAGVADLA